MNHVDGKLVEIESRRIRPARVTFTKGVITSIEEAPNPDLCHHFLLPGFIDAHVHIESSMLTPSQFARIAVRHGTVGVVTDPHEIANVLGVPGIQFMLDDAENVPFHFWFGAPSCVPATHFETSGAELSVTQTQSLLDDQRIHYLSEMMNFPGVLAGDAEVIAKINAASERHLKIDGHAPGLRGQAAARYFAAGISTDHECFTEDEAIDKLKVGALVLIREGSAARNFDALKGLIDRYPGRVMFCSDDKHPDDLVVGHINQLCGRAVAQGCDLFHTLMAACVTPVRHYDMNCGLLKVGDSADFIEVDSLTTFHVNRTFVRGQCVAEAGRSHISVTTPSPINRFHCQPPSLADIQVDDQPGKSIRVIVAHDGLLTTGADIVRPTVRSRQVIADVQRDLLKIVVINRYTEAPPAIGFIRGFGLQRGAIAGSVAHDSHNIIAVGTSDSELCTAVQAVIRCQGGLAAAEGDHVETLPLPIAGLISAESCESVAAQYQRLDRMAKSMGSSLGAPFMSLSFMALLVIPSLKLSDQGLFDGDQFRPVDLFV